MRFQRRMTHATTLIKINFVGSLRALPQDVSRRLFEQVRYSDVYLFIAYLDRHRMSPGWPKCISFTYISRRYLCRFPRFSESSNAAPVHPNELGSLLSECHSAYFSARKVLLVSRLTEQIRADLILQEQNSLSSYVFPLL